MKDALDPIAMNEEYGYDCTAKSGRGSLGSPQDSGIKKREQLSEQYITKARNSLNLIRREVGRERG
jgi:hypothetical protein